MMIRIVDGPSGEKYQMVAYDDLHLVLPHEAILMIREKAERSYIYWSEKRNAYVEYYIENLYYNCKEKYTTVILGEL